MRAQEHAVASHFDHELIRLASAAIEKKQPVKISLPVRNVHRTVGTLLAGEVFARFGATGLPDGTIDVTLTGSVGQSVGAFLCPGITLRIEGDANDYVGKGLSGGRVIVVPPAGATFVPHQSTIAGNVILYGATGGEVFLHGRAGERFAVRNSGAIAVVEGVGDHGCEYMTGGTVVVLGRTGRQFRRGHERRRRLRLRRDRPLRHPLQPGHGRPRGGLDPFRPGGSAPPVERHPR